MENKPKTSSYKRLKPYIKGSKFRLSLRFLEQLFQLSLQLLDQISLKKLPILLLKGLHLLKWGQFQVLIWTR